MARAPLPIHRALLAGDTETGVTIMRVVRELDAGPMMATLREPIATESSDQERSNGCWPRAVPQLLVDVVDRHGRGPGARRAADRATGVTYAE